MTGVEKPLILKRLVIECEIAYEIIGDFLMGKACFLQNVVYNDED